MSGTDWLKELNSLTSSGFPDLETLYVHPDYFGEVEATPLQRGICRVISGCPLAELQEHDHILEAIGDCSYLTGAPREVYIVSGIRTGKSLLNAAVCWYITQTVDLSKIKPGEIPRFSILATEKKTAQQTFNHIKGRGLASPILSKLIVPGSIKAESLLIRQESSGKYIEVLIVAGSESGSSVVSTWSAGCVCDEAPRWAAAGEASVNLGDLRHAILGRLLPGAQFFATGSPWAPHGDVYDIVQKRWKHPGNDVLVVKARGDWMNPSWWNPERIADLRARDPNVLLTECMAEFASLDENAYSLIAINKCTRKAPLPLVVPHVKGRHYRAAMDPATRGNGWTLVIGTRSENKRILVYAHEWRGTKESPLDTRLVMADIAEVLAAYEIRSVASDQWLADPLIERAHEFGFNMYQEKVNNELKAKLHLGLQLAMGRGELELPDDPVIRTDLVRVRKYPLQGGGIGFDLPRTPDGRHCDYIPPLLLALGTYCVDEDAPVRTEPMSLQEYSEHLATQLRKERVSQVKAHIQRADRLAKNGLHWS